MPMAPSLQDRTSEEADRALRALVRLLARQAAAEFATCPVHEDAPRRGAGQTGDHDAEDS